MKTINSWTVNGFKYWQIKTADAEIVASIADTYTPYWPPMHAKFKVYTLKNGQPPRFCGYAEGEQIARLYQVFLREFANRWQTEDSFGGK